MHIQVDDPEVAGLIKAEESRIENTLNLIAAENHCPESIMEALGSVFNTKTIEGYPGRRFHAGCVHADEVERLANERAMQLFNAEYVNVQPHSGTSANLAAYFSVLETGDKILSMGLPFGGHLSHGHSASMTSRCFDFSHYSVDGKTERIDYEEIRMLAEKVKPRMIIAGASSYPRLIDYGRIAEIARDVSAYLLADMAHIAGLVAAKIIPSPVPYCDFITFTCYKTMMGGRGGVILAKKKYEKRLNSAIFPGCQGTSPVNVIAAKAVIFKLAGEERFIKIQKNILKNAKELAAKIESRGYRLITDGTDNHQVLVDLSGRGVDGDTAEKALESAGIIMNRNVIPSDAGSKNMLVSGIRIGSSAVTARGMGRSEMARIADLIDTVLSNLNNEDALFGVRKDVERLCDEYPVYGEEDT